MASHKFGKDLLISSSCGSSQASGATRMCTGCLTASMWQTQGFSRGDPGVVSTIGLLLANMRTEIWHLHIGNYLLPELACSA